MCGKVFKESKPTQYSQKYSYDELFQLIFELRLNEVDLNASQYPLTVIGRYVAVTLGKGKEAVLALKNAMIGWRPLSAATTLLLPFRRRIQLRMLLRSN